MRIPEKGKAVLAGRQVLFSMGDLDNNRLHCNYCSDLHGATKFADDWQEVEITPIIHVPEEGKKVLCWNGDLRPKEPAVRYSHGVLRDGKLFIYEFKTNKGGLS